MIAGIFANLAPGAEVTCVRAVSSYGDTDDAAIAELLESRFVDDGSDDATAAVVRHLRFDPPRAGAGGAP